MNFIRQTFAAAPWTSAQSQRQLFVFIIFIHRDKITETIGTSIAILYVQEYRMARRCGEDRRNIWPC